MDGERVLRQVAEAGGREPRRLKPCLRQGCLLQPQQKIRVDDVLVAGSQEVPLRDRHQLFSERVINPRLAHHAAAQRRSLCDVSGL